MENNLDFTLLEILKMAKEIVINEHVDRRAEVHNQWLLDSDLLWKSRKLRLAYPPIPPYPTEIDIVVRAKTLMDFLDLQTVPGKNQPVAPEILLPETVEIVNTEPVSIIDKDPVAVSGNLFSNTNEDNSKKLSMLQHFENMKNAWKNQAN
jgi:hypothetical protein